MANRSAAHSPPLSGFSALRWALMSQQLSPSNQFGPSSGGAITAGLRVGHGDRRHLFVHGRGDQRWRSASGSRRRCVWTRSVGSGRGLVQCDVEPDDAGLPRSQFRCRRGCPDDAGPVAELVAGQGEQRLVARAHRHRRQRHLLASVFVSCSSYARWVLPSVAGTGTGAATTLGEHRRDGHGNVRGVRTRVRQKGIASCRGNARQVSTTRRSG